MNTYEVKMVYPGHSSGTYDKIVEASGFVVKESFVRFFENSGNSDEPKLIVSTNTIISIENIS